MYKIQTVFFMFIVFVLANLLMPGLPIAQETFNSTLMRPVGLAATPFGDVVVHSTIFSATLLTQFAPDRTVSNQSVIAKGPFDAELLGGGRLAVDPAGNAFYLLAPAGVLLVIDAALQEIARFDLRTLPVDATDVYDVNNNSASNRLDYPPALFGDLAVFSPSAVASQRIVLCSGISNGIPFVMRFTMPSMVLEPTALKIVLMSTAVVPTPFNAPRGIAVANPTGLALTTLPLGVPAPASCPDAVIKFDILDPANTAQILPGTENGGIPGWGMTTDTQNNFYLTTGGMEEPTCLQNGRASVIFVPSDLMGLGSSFQFSVFSSLRPEDVAVSPQTSAIYITVPDADAVVRFQALAPSLAPAPLSP